MADAGAVAGKRPREDDEAAVQEPAKRPAMGEEEEEGPSPQELAATAALELEASLKGMLVRQGAARAYLVKWSKQGTSDVNGNTVVWKFQKLMQIWLIDNMYDSTLVSDDTFGLVTAYLAGLKGAAKHRTLEAAKSILEHGTGTAPTSARQAFLGRWVEAAALMTSLQEGVEEGIPDLRPELPEDFDAAVEVETVRHRAQEVAATLA